MEVLILTTAVAFCVVSVSRIVYAIAKAHLIYWAHISEAEKHASKSHCMCGDRLDAHTVYGSNHTPVSEYDYYTSQIKLEI